MVSVQSTVDTGHEDMGKKIKLIKVPRVEKIFIYFPFVKYSISVHDAQMDYYGTKLATCSSDRSIRIFDVKDGTQNHVADLRG